MPDTAIPDTAIQYRDIDLLPVEVRLINQEAPQLKWLRISDLVIDPRYQRTIDKRGANNIAAIAQDFSWGRFSPVLCSPVSNTKYAIIDGQHRTHAARACGIEKVPAMVVNLTDEEQATAFVWVNASITAVTPLQIYKSSLAAGLPWAKECRDLVEETGCALMTTQYSAKAKMPKQVFCVGAVRKIVDRGDADTLAAVLSGMSKCDFLEPYHYSAGILGAMVNALSSLSGVTAIKVAQFLEENDIAAIERSVNRLREQPAYFREPQKTLMTASIKAKWNDYWRST